MTTMMEQRTTPDVREDERRQEDRRRVLRGARILFNQGYGAFECLVRNRSETGARLSFGDASGVPSLFEVEISGEQGRRQAFVRWRTLTEIGVALR